MMTPALRTFLIGLGFIGGLATWIERRPAPAWDHATCVRVQRALDSTRIALRAKDIPDSLIFPLSFRDCQRDSLVKR